jgi:predicted PurR-regulated permease PerM
MHPLLVILNNVLEDFAIVLRNENDRMYYFRAGVICSLVGWHLGTKIGKQLRDIHEPIPNYEDKMSLNIDRYFSKMPSNGPIQRGSWEFSIRKTLFIPLGYSHETFSKS